MLKKIGNELHSFLYRLIGRGTPLESPTASSQRSIAIGGDVIGSILVTGDRAKVFRGEYVDIARYYIDPWPVFERVQLERYVPRPSLEDAVDKFLSELDRGYLLLEAHAGLGKTTFVAHLSKARNYIHHFVELFPGDDGELPGIRNLAAQLAVAWRLLDDTDNYVVTASIGPEFLQNLINKAALRRDELRPAEKIVIVVDALDEAADTSPRNVFGLPRHLPRGVYIICTKRPQEVALSATTNRRVIRINGEAQDNREDLKSYLTTAAKEPKLATALKSDDLGVDDFVDLLLTKSRGVWIYVQFVLSEIETGARRPSEFANLPVGLWRYFADFFSRWAQAHQSEWDRTGCRLLTVLAAAQEDLDIEVLCRIGGIPDVALARALLRRHWSPFVARRSNSKNILGLYHASTRDFVLGRFDDKESLLNHELVFAEQLQAQVAEIHRTIAAFYVEHWGKFAAFTPRLSDNRNGALEWYGARHLPGHLSEGGAVAELHELFVLSRDGSNIWYAFKANHNDLSGYRKQLSVAAHRANQSTCSQREPPASALALVARYALIASSLNSVASRVPSAFTAFALDTGVWTLDRAITHAQHCEEGDTRARAYLALVQRTKGKDHLNCVRSLIAAISNAKGSPKSAFQARLWNEVFTSAPAALTSEDLQLCYNGIVQIDDTEDRLDVLRTFCKVHLEEPLAKSILAHLRSLAAPPKAEALIAAFAGHRIERMKVEVWSLASRYLGIGSKAAEYAVLVTIVRQAAEPYLMARVLRVLNEDDAYADLERKGNLPKFESLVEECMELCYAAEHIGRLAAHELLPLVHDGKRKFFSRLVKAHLLAGSDFERAARLTEVMRESPEFEKDLVALAMHDRPYPRALLVGTMLHVSPLAASRLVDVDLHSPDDLKGLIEAKALTAIVPSLPQGEVERLISSVTNLSDAETCARGLAQIALAPGADREDVFIACLERAQQLDEPEKAEQILEQLAGHQSPRLVRLAFDAAQRARDEGACLVAVVSLIPFLAGRDRLEAISFAAALVPKAGPEWTRMEHLLRILTSMQGELASEEETALQKAFDASCDTTSSVRKVRWLVGLSQHSIPVRRAQLLQQALLEARGAADGRVRVELISHVWPHMLERTQEELAKDIEQELIGLDPGDRRYAFIPAAGCLGAEVRRKLCSEIIEETPDDKLYALEDFCLVLDATTAQLLRERVLDAEVDQIMPALATALGRLGLLDGALDMAAKASELRRLDALLGIAQYLKKPHVAAALKLARAIQGNEYVKEKRDELLAAIASRQSELGEWQSSLRTSSEINSALVQSVARLRIAAAVPEAARAAIIPDALQVCRSTASHFDREQINRAFLTLDPSLLSVADLISLYTINMELTAAEKRTMSYYALSMFVPALHARVSNDVVSSLFCEIRRIHGWWP